MSSCWKCGKDLPEGFIECQFDCTRLRYNQDRKHLSGSFDELKRLQKLIQSQEPMESLVNKLVELQKQAEKLMKSVKKLNQQPTQPDYEI